MFKISIQFSCDWLKSFQPKTHKNTMTKLTFNDVATQLISQLETGKSKSTVDNYRTALRSFCHFAGTGVLIEQIDVPLMEHYQQWLHEQHVTPNTVSCYMRSLRSLLYRLKPSLKQQSLFDTVYTGKAPTEKRSVGIEEICKIKNLNLPYIMTTSSIIAIRRGNASVSSWNRPSSRLFIDTSGRIAPMCFPSCRQGLMLMCSEITRMRVRATIAICVRLARWQVWRIALPRM